MILDCIKYYPLVCLCVCDYSLTSSLAVPLILLYKSQSPLNLKALIVYTTYSCMVLLLLTFFVFFYTFYLLLFSVADCLKMDLICKCSWLPFTFATNKLIEFNCSALDIDNNIISCIAILLFYTHFFFIYVCLHNNYVINIIPSTMII